MRTCPGKAVVLLFGLDDEISTQAVRAFSNGVMEKSTSLRPSFLKPHRAFALAFWLSLAFLVVTCLWLSLAFLVVIPEGDLLLLLPVPFPFPLPLHLHLPVSSPSHPKPSNSTGVRLPYRTGHFNHVTQRLI